MVWVSMHPQSWESLWTEAGTSAPRATDMFYLGCGEEELDCISFGNQCLWSGGRVENHRMHVTRGPV